MAEKQKLELTWVGKKDNLLIEPRILIKNQSLSFQQKPEGLFEHLNFFDNILIHGDNLLALKALENDFNKKIKCIYIDPPYNTGSAFEHYDDNLEQSTWLSLMRGRLILLKNLLRDDGVIFIQIDDNEQAYLKVLCDEIFGRGNFVSAICVKMSTVSGVKTTHREKTIVKEKEMILVYANNIADFSLKPQYVPTNNFDSEFQYFLNRNNSVDPDDWTIERLADVLTRNKLKIDMEDKRFEAFLYQNRFNIWRRAFIRNDYKKLSQDNPEKIYFVKSEDKDHYYYRGREMFFLADKYHECFTEKGKIFCMSNLLADMWLDVNTGKLFNEGGVEFRNSKKPEFLIARILNMTTDEGDFVLDSFLGSGTTCAVAHKMKRRWIGIEMGDHAYTHCKPRIDNVITGNDFGGVTLCTGWTSGGGYSFYELAPSLIKKDSFGEAVINPEYSPDALAAAIALHEGFVYDPSQEIFWKQSKSNENAFLYVTTSHVTGALLKEISNQMAANEYLLVVCKSFEKAAADVSSKITIKKIPQSLLSKCEFGKDNYNLNIINPPVYEEDEQDE